jgi:hypothetical protein
MTIRFVTSAVLVVFLGGAAGLVSAQRGQPGAACDKGCLQQIADAYLAALAAHDPSKAPIAPDARFTEQAQPMKIGEGQLCTLTVDAPITFKIPVADRC